MCIFGTNPAWILIVTTHLDDALVAGGLQVFSAEAGEANVLHMGLAEGSKIQFSVDQRPKRWDLMVIFFHINMWIWWI